MNSLLGEIPPKIPGFRCWGLGLPIRKTDRKKDPKRRGKQGRGKERRDKQTDKQRKRKGRGCFFVVCGMSANSLYLIFHVSNCTHFETVKQRRKQL